MILQALLLATTLFAVSGGVPVEEQPRPDETVRYCDCVGIECKCCVDFNLTFIDLGGPGCVKMQYLGEEKGIMVNVSYGDSQLHQGQVKGTEDSATCMDILLDLAHMCATFSNITRIDGGMRACAALEPTFFGDLWDSYHLGCFDMGPGRMQLLPTRRIVVASEPAEGSPSDADNQPVSVLDAFNETAKDGIAWLTRMWVLANKNAPNATEHSDVEKLLDGITKEPNES